MELIEELELLNEASWIQSKQKDVAAVIGSKPVEHLNRSCRCKNFTCIQGKAGKAQCTWKRHQLKVTKQTSHTRFRKSSDLEGIASWENTGEVSYRVALFSFFFLCACLHLQLKIEYEASYALGLYQNNCFYDEDSRFQWHHSEAQLLLRLPCCGHLSGMMQHSRSDPCQPLLYTTGLVLLTKCLKRQ